MSVVVLYTTPNTQVKLTIKKGTLATFFQCVVLPQSLIECLGKVGSAINILIEIGEPLSQLHPTAELVFGLIKSVVAVFEKQKLCYEKLSDLFEKMASCLPYFKKMQKLRNFSNVQETIESILIHMEAALKVVLSHNTFSSLKQFFDFVVSSEADKFSDLSVKFDKLLDDYNLALQLDMAILQDQLVEQAAQNQVKEALEKLNYVQVIPGDQCLEKTRVSTLADIDIWAQNSTQPICWLSGPAGTGKSTIAATAALNFEETRKLAAFYTCRRDQKALGNPLQLWKNICYRLAIVYKPFGLKLAKVITDDLHFGSGAETISVLFQKLFKHPLSMLDAEPPHGPLIIVIDALDECGGEMDRVQLLTHLLELTRLCSWIKILITSRNNPEIQKYLQGQAQQIELNPAESGGDVATFIRVRYSQFELSDVEITKLIQAANGLFIWATTAFKYLEQSIDYNYTTQLLLGSQGHGSSRVYETLHNLYYMVLSTGIGSNPANLMIFHQIMPVVLLAAQPSSIYTLSKLTEYQTKVVENMVKKLHAVMIINSDKTVRILHPSFVEYLLNEQNHPEKLYWIDSYAGHSTLVGKCFDILKKELRFNMYDIPSSYALNKEVVGLEDKKHDLELSHIHYAALFWTFHLQACKEIATKQEDALVNLFGGPYTLYWIEVLGLHGRMYEALRSIQNINIGRLMTNETQELLSDLYHLLDLAKEVASVSIPHIYISCLAYMPQSCQLGKKILQHFDNIFKIQGMPDIWIPHHMVVGNHGSCVNAVAYSPSGRHVVSAAIDGTLKIWDANTGQLIGKPLQGHSTDVRCVAYSPDGNYVVSGAADNTVRVWDAKTGQPAVQPLEGHSDYVRSVACSPDASGKIACLYLALAFRLCFKELLTLKVVFRGL
ncbi:hypothetical protein BDN72DRAFT_917225 [Pluteus cervinus]|uniref:Uncharacterized protein n=1 Tax=Pluteus cervinus TaxID=181527 RepID=A0ACD3AMJ3_9AGAR|nr:hypothetical protein BDN72DRAFT_917225 [Pluteus cervinus]